MRTRRTVAPVTVAALAVLLVVAGCTSAPNTPGAAVSPAVSTTPAVVAPTPSVSPTAPAVGPPAATPGAPTTRSTWTLSLAATSCALWSGEMYPDQRLAAAAQLLTAARGRERRSAPPADGLVTAFQAGVTAQCAVDSGVTVQSAADAVYAGAGHAEYSG